MAGWQSLAWLPQFRFPDARPRSGFAPPGQVVKARARPLRSRAGQFLYFAAQSRQTVARQSRLGFDFGGRRSDRIVPTPLSRDTAPTIDRPPPLLPPESASA